jgi:hypothetical protein
MIENTFMASGSEKRKRNKLVALRLTQEEHDALHKRCDDYGLSIGELVRVQCLDQPMPRRRVRRAAPDVQAVARVLGELGKIGSNMNQIAKHLNSGKTVELKEIQSAMTDIFSIRDACMKALGHER